MGSPSDLGVGAAIAIGLATSLASSPPAQAQDLNLQTQLNIFSPPLTVQPLGSIGQQSALSALKSCSSSASVARLKENSPWLDFLEENPDLTVDDVAARSNLFRERLDKFQRQHRQPKFGPVPINLCYTVQPTQLKTTFPFNPTYETDVLKKGDNSSTGESAGFGGNFLLTTAGLRPFDLIAMGAGETSVRYTSPFFSSASFDSISSQLFYQAFLYGSGYVIDQANQVTHVGDVLQYAEQHKTDSLLSTGLITLDTVAFGVQNQTAFTPTFHTEKADLLTPQFTIARQNINLDGPDTVAIRNCAALTTGFCHYADLSLTVGQTFSDVLSQQNFNVAGSAAVGWRIDRYWKLAINTMATGKDYEDFVGGRQDLLLQAGPALTYSYTSHDNMNFTFQLPVTYYKNYSTVSTAAWAGLIIQPTVSVAFSYTPTGTMLR
jgi:hypothetical protein